MDVKRDSIKEHDIVVLKTWKIEKYISSKENDANKSDN